jgi:hypothetical protein
VSFLYPLFLIAGVSLAIPILIHLFNLRRYKTVLFPHTRFLKNIQLQSQKQSQLRYKWLLAARLLFLAMLILAFAQPLFNNSNKTDSADRMQVIYIDNSYSMSVKKGARSLLDMAKDVARKQIQNAPLGTRYIVLSNDKPASYRPVPADKALTALSAIELSAAGKGSAQVFATVQSMMQGEAATASDLYYYSDFQENAFAANKDAGLTKNIIFHGIPVQADAVQNIYIDTVYLNAPVLQTGQNNQLIVRSRKIGDLPKETPIIQLSVNGQVKSAATPRFEDKDESIDTLSFQVNDANWQKITIAVNDASLRYDDTFRISARSSSNLSVLVLNEGQPNPYIQAAFRSYNGFRLQQLDINAAPADWKEYNLVILNGVTNLSSATVASLSATLQAGKSVCIFPGRSSNVALLNEGLKQIVDIQIKGLDTAAQVAGSLQQGSDLVKDIFERVPENVQLPQANWHYIISAGLSANQQSILSFRNGDPLFARYTPTKGQLYISATGADIGSGNFPGSFFFVPFLYQMAIQAKGGDIYSITSGMQQPAYMPLNNAGERNMVHLYAPDIDAIPPQRPNGAGLDVFIDQAVQQSGFYALSAVGNDTGIVAMNQSRSESELELWNISSLKSTWKGDDVRWLTMADISAKSKDRNWGSFPLWKVCAILAVLMLAVETYLLAGRSRKQIVASQ